jgi:hypothetical protein
MLVIDNRILHILIKFSLNWTPGPKLMFVWLMEFFHFKISKLSLNQWTNKEMGNWTKQNFLKRRNSNGQTAHETMLTISSHKGNTNQNDTKSLSHPCYNSYHQKIRVLSKPPRPPQSSTKSLSIPLISFPTPPLIILPDWREAQKERWEVAPHQQRLYSKRACGVHL